MCVGVQSGEAVSTCGGRWLIVLPEILIGLICKDKTNPPLKASADHVAEREEIRWSLVWLKTLWRFGIGKKGHQKPNSG